MERDSTGGPLVSFENSLGFHSCMDFPYVCGELISFWVVHVHVLLCSCGHATMLTLLEYLASGRS